MTFRLVRLLAGLLLPLCVIAAPAQAAPAAVSSPAFEGDWEITVAFADGSQAATLSLKATATGYEGASGPLDENGYWPLTYAGTVSGRVLRLTVSTGKEPIGDLSLAGRGDDLAGSGTLYGVPVTAIGKRLRSPVTTAARVIDFRPTVFHLRFSADNPIALRIAPGDTVRTETVDNEGRDASGAWRSMPGNAQTGPFWIEGAMPGDTLVVRLLRVRTNRPTARMYSGQIQGDVVTPGYPQTRVKDWEREWRLDPQAGAARPAKPSAALKDFEIPLRPMIGSIGVAPPQAQAINAGDLGYHGGNLDYRRLAEGATLYLPVFRQGALLSLGDGHAAQGDGEITGQGLETSLDVEFTVELIKGPGLGQPWAEDSEFVMVSGIGNGLDAALRMATTGLALWLKQRYGLNDSEVALVLGSSVEYDIAEVVDPRPHVVAKIRKTTLARLAKAN